MSEQETLFLLKQSQKYLNDASDLLENIEGLEYIVEDLLEHSKNLEFEMHELESLIDAH